jgi:hypothetical protein
MERPQTAGPPSCLVGAALLELSIKRSSPQRSALPPGMGSSENKRRAKCYELSTGKTQLEEEMNS